MASNVFRKGHLSGGNHGALIAVTGTATGSAVTVHTATSENAAEGTYDELFIHAANIGTASVTLTIEWGGTAAGNRRKYVIPPDTEVFIIEGDVLRNALTVKAFASEANVINLGGWYNKLTVSA